MPKMDEIENMPNSIECGMQYFVQRRTPKRQAVPSMKPRGDLISKLENLVSNAASYPQDQHLVT